MNCSKCEVRPRESRNLCTPCRREYNREYHERNKERSNLRSRQYYQENRQHLQARSREYYRDNKPKAQARDKRYRTANPDKILENRLKLAYGMTLVEYRDLEETQQGVCAICSNKCPMHPRLSVDHCHETGKVRGLLCGHCNTALGNFKDDPDVMSKALKYLEEAQ